VGSRAGGELPGRREVQVAWAWVDLGGGSRSRARQISARGLPKGRFLAVQGQHTAPVPCPCEHDPQCRLLVHGPVVWRRTVTGFPLNRGLGWGQAGMVLGCSAGCREREGGASGRSRRRVVRTGIAWDALVTLTCPPSCQYRVNRPSDILGSSRRLDGANVSGCACLRAAVRHRFCHWPTPAWVGSDSW
jgi:hypothetical protein